MTTNRERAEIDFAEFFDAEFSGQLRRAAFLLRDHGAAEDVVHDAFVEVWRRWGDISDRGPYLSPCVLSGYRDHASRRRRWWAFDRSARFIDDHVSPFDELHDLLVRLPFNQRCAVVLRSRDSVQRHRGDPGVRQPHAWSGGDAARLLGAIQHRPAIACRSIQPRSHPVVRVRRWAMLAMAGGRWG